MQKLFLILSDTDGRRYANNYWREAIKQFSKQFDVHVIEVGSAKDDYQLIDDINVKTTQLTEVLDWFKSGYITDGDVFLFTDAWNFGMMPLAYLRKSMNLNVKFIGFWGNSFFNGATFNAKSFYNTKKQGTGWAKNFEKGLLQTYDINLFATETLAINFRIRYFPLMVWNPVYLCPWPFDYIKKARSIEWEKKDSIIVPFEPIREIEYAMIDELKTDYPELKIVYASKLRMSRETYLEELQRAKIMLVTPNLVSSIDLTVIWEGMNYGVVPLLPTGPLLPIFTDEYRYPADCLKGKKVLHFMRRKERLVAIINDILTNNHEYQELIDRDLPKFTQYSNASFLDAVNGETDKLIKIVSKAKWLKVND